MYHNFPSYLLRRTEKRCGDSTVSLRGLIRRKWDFGEHGLVLTREALFCRKAELFPGCLFAVGVDTIERISNPRYYQDAAAQAASLAKIAEHGCRFLVFGRRIESRPEGAFRNEEVELDPRLRELCEFISRLEFDHPVSSTQLRTGA